MEKENTLILATINSKVIIMLGNILRIRDMDMEKLDGQTDKNFLVNI